MSFICLIFSLYCLRMYEFVSTHLPHLYRNATARTLLCLCAPHCSRLFSHINFGAKQIYLHHKVELLTYYIKGGSTTTTVVSFNIWNGLQWWASRVFVYIACSSHENTIIPMRIFLYAGVPHTNRIYALYVRIIMCSMTTNNARVWV